MLTVSTYSPNSLLAKIKRAIDDRKVVTWAYDADGDFFHTPEQWRKHAWLRPGIQSGALNLSIVKNTRIPLTKEVYGVYHGRFLEMLLAHFRAVFLRASAN
jgi:hypothetical protein